MQYFYKEYKHVFDTPAKRQQETVIVNKIMDLLNKNKFDTIDDFISKNQTYQSFLKNNELEIVVKHFGNTLNEADFKLIQEEMIRLTEKKKNFEKESIKTTSIDDKEYNTYEGMDKTIFLDNSHSNMTIERQLEVIQPTQQEFQTADIKQNTDNMMKELEQEKKEKINLKYLKEFDINTLNESQKEIFKAALEFQAGVQNPIRIDIDRRLIVDEFNNISKIEKKDGNFSIINENQNEMSNIKEQKTFQKKLVPSTNTIYSANNN